MIDGMAPDPVFQRAILAAGKLRGIGDAVFAAKMKRKSGLWARVYHWAVLGVRVAACPHSCARAIAADSGPF